ncbi:acylase [Algoriphagus sediminis]|uniref:Acylase n=1 Tax=Algoriphagus sediminis TaxID=3057113 RepID=A0ABT7YHB0_9BACT|nr:acylase [Algoriphagus sediminis]MDN3205902.1 acylase [Algoriphagus sediminis]
MKKYTFIFLPLIFLASCSSNLQPSGWDVSQVEIVRDEYGVPHIFGTKDEDVAYGLAWAHAEDDFKTIQTTLLAGKRMAGRVFGEAGAAADFFGHLLETRELAEAKYETTFSEEFKRVLEGYAAGMNDYAYHHPEEVLLKDAFPVTTKEITAAYILSLAQMSGADRAVTQIVEGTVDQAPIDLNPKGSNAIAVHSSRTDTEESFLAINSHQPLEGPVAWYEAHLHSEEGWNILGGLFPGGAMIFHGVNENLGWAHTVNFPDLLDVFQLQINPDDENQYLVDGEWLELEKRTVWLKVKLWDLITIPVPKSVWKSIYGPTLVTDQGAFSIRMGVLDRIGAPEQWWRMNKASNLTEFRKAMSAMQLTSFNTVYADKHDSIFYVSNGLLPKRNPEIDFTGTVAGNTEKAIWDSYYDFDDLPQQINPESGYLFNTNHSPFLASGFMNNMNPEDYPKGMDYLRRDNNRSTRFRELMDDSTKISYEDFKRIKYDGQLPENLAYRTNMESLFTLNPKKYPEIKQHIKVIQAWDKKSGVESEGAALFAFQYYYWWDKFEELGRSWETTLTEEEAAEGLMAAKEHFQTFFGKEIVELGEYQKLVRGEKALPLWGIDDVITAMRSQPWENGMRKGVQGESYIMMVKFGEGLPKIETVNVFGASNKPESPHFDDQMELFLKQELKPMTLDKALVYQNAKSIYHPGSKPTRD